jgi:bifunctional DNase/RNase
MAAGLRKMVVESVRVHMLSSQHVVILREAERERYLPIWIGSWEAQSIAMKLQGVTTERPLTHDLLATLLGELGANVLRIIVSDLSDETYRARIVVDHEGGSHDIDARPSDAIALAVRVSAPIFATEEVLDRAGVMPEVEEDEKLDVFRDFVNSLEVDIDTSVEEGPGPPGGPARDQRVDDEPGGGLASEGPAGGANQDDRSDDDGAEGAR